MVYVSSTAVQKNTKNIEPGQTNQDILKVEVLTNGNLNPFNITSLTFNTNGSTDPHHDIARARLYYTGSSNALSTTNQFGEGVISPDGEFIFSGIQELGNGKNNFWLVYDVYDNATLGNVVDAQCLSVTVDTPHDLIIGDPAGSRTIGFQYCEAGASNSTYEFISKVSMGDINNPTDKAQNGYGDHSNLTLDAYAGETIPVYVTNGVPYFSDQVLIWVDWNVDGDFDDAGELVFTSERFGGEVFQAAFTVPTEATPGTTRMRIRLHDADNGPNDKPCGYGQWGEVEDYTLRILAPDACGQLTYLSYKAENIPGSYEPLTVEGNIIATADYNDANSDPQEIGFPFVFKCDTFSQFILNTNGFIKLGNTPPSRSSLYFHEPRTAFGGPFANHHPEDINLIAPLNLDLDAGTGTPEYRVAISGDAPNRICTIQYKNVRDGGTNPAPQYNNIEFQIKLHETTNVIEFVYGDWEPSDGVDDFRAVACGIKGSSSLNDQILVASKTIEQPWEEISFNNGNFQTNTAISYARYPDSPKPDPGRTFRFTPTYYEDILVKQVYALGDASVYYSNPQTVDALVINNGLKEMTNIPVTFSMDGANEHFETTTIDYLAPGESVTARFSGFPAPNEGVNNMTVNVPNDQDNANNTASWSQTGTSFTYSYALSGEGIDKLGVANGESFIFYAQYRVNGSAAVDSITAFIPNEAINIGKTIYGVVSNTDGVILGQSVPLVIEAGHLGTWQSFFIPEQPTIRDAAFFAGLAVEVATDIYYPVGVQAEDPLRPSTFYTSDLTGGNITPFGYPYRFMIGAMVKPTPPVAGIAGNDLVVCSGTGGTIGVVEYAGFIQWQESPDGIENWVNVTSGEGQNTNTYTTPHLDQTTYYRAEISQPTFDPLYTNLVQVLVMLSPDAAGPIQGPDEVCVGDTLVYWVDPIAHAQIYGWTLPDGFLTEPSIGPQIQVVIGASATSGTISVLGINPGCFGESSSIEVIVHPQPQKPVITQTGNTLYSSASDGNQWYDANGPIPGANGPEYVVTEDGTYYVVVTLDGCASVPSDALIVIISSSENLLSKNGVSIYPNPVSAQLNISVSTWRQPIRYTILDAPGRRLTSGSFSGSTLIDTRLYTPGLYFIQLEVDGQSMVTKFIKH